MAEQPPPRNIGLKPPPSFEEAEMENLKGWGREGLVFRARIFKLLRSLRIDSKELIPLGCVARRASTTILFLLCS